MHLIHIFYCLISGIPRLNTPLKLRILSMPIYYFMVMLPIDRIIESINNSGYFLRRSELWVVLLQLLVQSNPMLYDMALHMVDFQGIFFVGFVMWTISQFLNDGHTATLAVCAFHCSIHNGLVFHWLFPLLAVYKLFSGRKGDRSLMMLIKCIGQVASVYIFTTLILEMPRAGLQTPAFETLQKTFSWSYS